MKKSKRTGRRILVGLLIVVSVPLTGIQFIPVDRSNPPVTMDVRTPPEVKAVLRQSCYDCHSNETQWPWYSYAAPVSWLVAKDVREGREQMNFSEWDGYSAAQRADLIGEAYEEASEGSMPLPIYVRMHPEARLTGEDLEMLRQWAVAARGDVERRDDDGEDETGR